VSKQKIRIVGVDTTILIWGVRKQGTDGELDRARWLFEKLDAEESQIIISTSVLTEYLTCPDPILVPTPMYSFAAQNHLT
jgi:hypothetical protein